MSVLPAEVFRMFQVYEAQINQLSTGEIVLQTAPEPQDCSGPKKAGGSGWVRGGPLFAPCRRP